eukprot:CAMPEP_0197587804 /NCGR_PEP_ID=MMETSP1326-20131121/9300_1 /TAXON_ID=1155430 /ORGANISM="Genus nov. species nov., Strain RCC2288" /LENGTH=233 /DNA_ID=CAMNT_0043152567 /DNA_START=201 /DNA_END=902 /DNA_ORIENTATION=-
MRLKANGADDDSMLSRGKAVARVMAVLVVFALVGSYLPIAAVRVAGGRDGTATTSDTAILGAHSGAAAVAASASAAALGTEGEGGDGTRNLLGGALVPCSPPDQSSQTGWNRDGACAWDEGDRGYHAVCAKMDDAFLKSSAETDGNDLSSVVAKGEYWCVCAWAWASAVSRDPVTYEGLELQCDRSNEKLRDVYRSYIDSHRGMSSPSGASYGPEQALEAVNKLCPANSATEE